MPNEVESGWRLSLYPEAAEAGGCFVSPRRPWSGRYAVEPDEDRAMAEAIRRARGHVRRYAAANRLNRLGTLTYAESCREPVRLRADLADFFKRLRNGLGRAFPYVWVPEWHPGGHGLHAHFVVGRYIHYRAIRAAWGRGLVHIKLIGDLPVGSGAIEEARRAGRYVSKYIGKDLGSAGEAGLHRYDVAEGFGPKVRKLRGPSLDDVLAQAIEVMGREPVEVWDSADEPVWDRPHSVRVLWA